MSTLATAPSEILKKAFFGLSPLRTYVYSCVVYAIGLVVIPARPDIYYSLEALLFLITCVVAAALGLSFGSTQPINFKAIRLSGNRFNWSIAAKRCIVLASIGVILAFIDRYIIRGVPFGIDILASRSAIEEASTGPVGIVAAFMSSFAMFGLIMVWQAQFFQQPLGWVYRYAAKLNLSLYLALSIMLGSRSLLLACIIIHALATIFFRRCRGDKLNRKAVIGIALGLITVTLVLATMMLERLNQMEIDVLDSIQDSAYAETLKPTDSMLNFLQQNALLASLGAAIYSLVLYFFHGFYEFLALFDNFKGTHTHGQQLFWLGRKLLGFVIPFDPPIDLEILDGYRFGIFTTFAGPFFTDFALAAPLFIAITFALLALPYRFVLTGDLRWLVVLLQVSVILVLTPVLALLQSAVGTYILVAATITVYLTPKLNQSKFNSL